MSTALLRRGGPGLLLLFAASCLCGCQTDRDGVKVNLSAAARVYRQYQDKQPSREQMERVIEQLPAQQLTDLGVLYERERRLDRATWAYQHAIWRQPYYARAYVNLGNVLRQQGRVEDAKGRYRQALAADATSVEAANNFADLCASDGRDTEEAIGLLQPLLARAGALRPYALDTLGWLHHQKQQNARARQLLSTALSEAPAGEAALRATIHGHLAVVCRELGLADEASRHAAAAGPVRETRDEGR